MKQWWAEVSRDQILGYASLLIAITVFSTVEVASKELGTGMPPLLLAAVRFVIAGLVLLFPAWAVFRMRSHSFSRKDWLIIFGLAVFGVSFSIGVYHLAIPRLQANVAAVVFSANPAFVVLFSPWILHEKLTLRKSLGVLSGLAGVVVFAFKGGRLDVGSLSGLMLMGVALITFALYTVLSKKVMPRFGAVVMLCLVSLIGGAMLFPVSWFLEGNPWPFLCAGSWWGILYLSVVATAVGYWTYFFGVINVGAARGSMFFFLKPAMASCFAWLFLGETITSRIVVGSVLVLLALFFALVPVKRRV